MRRTPVVKDSLRTSATMDQIWQQINTLRTQQSRLTTAYYYLSEYGFPTFNKLSAYAKNTLFEHPDLTSITLLMVILYISFVFLVRAWRMTICMLQDAPADSSFDHVQYSYKSTLARNLLCIRMLASRSGW